MEDLRRTCLSHGAINQVTIVNTVGLHRHGTPITIGRPTPNNTVYILNEQREPVTIGGTGLMWAGGVGVSAGYLNLPDRTAEKFIMDPFLGNGCVSDHFFTSFHADFHACFQRKDVQHGRLRTMAPRWSVAASRPGR
jgi:non-ribosomal peptide synthetase component F